MLVMYRRLFARQGQKEFQTWIPAMFANRIARHVEVPESIAAKTGFVLIGAGCTSPAVSSIYRAAYLRAFATVQKRVIRRRQVRAARLVSWN